MAFPGCPQELDRVAQLIQEDPSLLDPPPPPPAATAATAARLAAPPTPRLIGLRINPQVCACVWVRVCVCVVQ